MLRVQKNVVPSGGAVKGFKQTRAFALGHADNIQTATVNKPALVINHSQNYDAVITQPAGTILRNLIAYTSGTITTGAGGTHDVNFSLGSVLGEAQYIAASALLDGGTVTWTAGAPLYIIKDSHGHGANAFVSTATNAGVVGGPATTGAIAILSSLVYVGFDDRTLFARITPINGDLAAGAGVTIKFIAEFQDISL